MLLSRVVAAVLACCLIGSSPLPAAAARKSKGSRAKSSSSKRKATKPSPAATKLSHAMPLRDAVAQLVMVPFYGEPLNTRSRAYRDYVSLVRDLKIGGLIILNGTANGVLRKPDPHAMAAFINRMQRLAKLPLMVGGDFERGASMRVTSTAQFPHAMAFGAAGDIENTRQLGKATAREARAMGVQWLFVPDADVNNNPDNPIINTRSFGEDPQKVAEHVTAFIEGARSDPKNPVLVTVKHFPGHGDTATDSHIGLATVTASRERMDQVELVPFKAAIAAGVDSVMTAHLAVPALEPDPIPGTVSHKILTGLLRDELGFQGLVVTDAMDMQGLTKSFPAGEASVRAIEAGADLLLIPSDPREAVRAVVAAVQSGRIPRKRIDDSLARVLAAKSQVGLMRHRFVNVEEMDDQIDTPEDEELARSVAAKAITLVKNQDEVIPLRKPAAACFLVLGSNRYSSLGRDFSAALQRRVAGVKPQFLDPQMPPEELSAVATGAASCETVVLATFVQTAAYRGDAGLGGNYPAFLDQIFKLNKPVVLASFGSPYLLRAYPQVQAYLATFSTVSPSEEAMVAALMGDTPITGKLPVSIPGLAKIGDGLRVPPEAPAKSN